MAHLDVSGNAITLYNGTVYIGLDEENAGKISLYSPDLEDYVDIVTGYSSYNQQPALYLRNIYLTDILTISNFKNIIDDNQQNIFDHFFPTDLSQMPNYLLRPPLFLLLIK